MIAWTFSWAFLQASAADCLPSQTSVSSASTTSPHSDLRIVGSLDWMYEPASDEIFVILSVNFAIFGNWSDRAESFTLGIPWIPQYFRVISGDAMNFRRSHAASWCLTPFQEEN